MSDMMNFATWFLSQLPGFLLAPPISGFTGLSLLAFVVAVTRRIMFGRR